MNDLATLLASGVASAGRLGRMPQLNINLIKRDDCDDYSFINIDIESESFIFQAKNY